ncbi:diacylglycerol/lipid kinase family protein [Virgibacillus xinjiangensis]|uniref:Diacylglycerol/lipid kinase family protein n=1 Tax=Virgibacillus xinjiangensis TaxID=393090 RepID=A0ABV7CSW6_9BACI
MEKTDVKFDKALFLYNGNAGNDELKWKLAKTLPVLAEGIRDLRVVMTSSAEEAVYVCRKHSKEVDLLIILGGDGTVHQCINSISGLTHRPVLAILPGGTSNDFSRMLGMPQDLEQAAAALLEGEVMNIDVGTENERYFLNFWGIGLVAETSRNIDAEQKRNLGVLSYFMSTIRTVNQAEPFYYKIVADGATYEDEAVLVIVLNGKFLGTREVPIPSIQADDGLLDVLVVKTSTLASFRELLSIRNPNADMERFRELEHFQAKEVNITTQASKEADMDGELVGATPANISILPHHLQIIGFSQQ